jgi:hypothetical protein
MRLISPWRPRLGAPPGTPCERLARALAGDITSGAVPAGSRLPAHRDLAHPLGLRLGTVTKAYAVLGERRLAVGVHGRGMFVTGEPARPRRVVDLSVDAPPQVLTGGLLAKTLTDLARRLDAATFGTYMPAAGRLEHRAIAARWLNPRGRPSGSRTPRPVPWRAARAGPRLRSGMRSRRTGRSPLGRHDPDRAGHLFQRAPDCGAGRIQATGLGHGC